MRKLILSGACALFMMLQACDAAPVMGVETLATIDADALKSMQETLAKTEITQLVHAYGITRDNYDGQAYANLFAHDGKFHFRGELFEGREAIASRVPSKDSTNLVSMHFVTTSHVEITSATTATGVHYGIVYIGEYPEWGQKSGPVAGSLASQGIYTDSYRLTDEGWKISERAYSPVFTAPEAN